MKLTKKRFGRTHYRVSELCLSTSNFSRYAGQEESFAILDAFREAGGNFIQTSGMCPGVNLGDGFLGMPEELLGRWLKLRRVERESVVIATRIALTRPVIGGLATYTDLIRHCADDSIRRIGCGYLDFLAVEWTDDISPIAETIAALEAVIGSGQVRAVVPANFSVENVRTSFATTRLNAAPIAGVQVDYSLAVRASFEGAMAKLSADHDLGVVGRSPLAGGYLASINLPSGLGALRRRDVRDRHAALAAAHLWPELTALARAHGGSHAQVALSWVLAHPRIASVLVSVSSVSQFRELLAATRLRLCREELARLEFTPALRGHAECIQ